MLQSYALFVPQHQQQQPASPTPTRPLHASQYGSIANADPSISYKNTSGDTWKTGLKPPSTPTPSTVSPNDDDDGLYLLWTHQLLKERQGSTDGDDHSSTDSSLTDGDDDNNSRPWTLNHSYSSSTSVYKPSIHMSTSSYSQHHHSNANTNLLTGASTSATAHDEDDEVGGGTGFFSGWWKTCFLCGSK